MGQDSAADDVRHRDPKQRAVDALLDASQYGVLLLDERLRILWMSNAGAASIRYAPEDLIGRRAGDFLDPSQSPGVLETVSEVLGAAGFQEPGWQLGVRVKLLCGDGVSRDFEFGGWMVGGRGAREMLLVFLEVTDRARLEDVLTAVTEHDLDTALQRFLQLASEQVRADVGIALHPTLGGTTYATPGARASLFDDLAEPPPGVHVRAVESASGVVAGWLVVDRDHMTPWGIETIDRLTALLGLMLSHQATLTDLVDAAATDPLTGLSNRRVLDFSLLAAEANPSQGWALLYCDLDRFKAINDDWGHDAGDAVLRAVASRLLQVVRSADVVARLGGDEFVVLAHADPTQAAHLAARVREVLAPPIVDDHGTFEVGVSVGLATADTRDGVRALLSDADDAMRRVKVLHRGGR